MNDPATVVSDALAIAGRSTGRTEVLSVLNGEGEEAGTPRHAAILAVNQSLADKFGGDFFDVRGRLAAGDPSDVVPEALRSDDIHLNGDGYRAAARCVADWLGDEA